MLRERSTKGQGSGLWTGRSVESDRLSALSSKMLPEQGQALEINQRKHDGTFKTVGVAQP